MGVLKAACLFLRAWFVTRAHLAIENLALRQQVAAIKRSHKRPKLRLRDRVFWTWLMRLWPHWKSALVALEVGLGNCEAGDGRRLAPPGISSLLALEVKS